MYALAANCRDLSSLTLGGYNEHVTDGGMMVLFEAATRLTAVQLSSRLLKVTDASGTCLAAHCPLLNTVKLTRAMGDATLVALARSCPSLHKLDLHRSTGASTDGVAAVLDACTELCTVVLPSELQLGQLLATRPHCDVRRVEEQQLLMRC